MVNVIDKDRVRGDEGFGDSSAVWRARLFLFIGFSLIAGGLAGSVVRTFLSLLFRMFVLSRVLTGCCVCVGYFFFLDCACVEVHCQRIRGAVQLLWILQCCAKRRFDVVGYCPLDIAERWRRV